MSNWNATTPLQLTAILMGAVIFGGCHPHSQFTESGGDREVSVAAAADLKFALDKMVAAFRTKHPGIRITIAYGSSGNFYSQLANQAPFDLFLSADLAYPKKLSEQGLTIPGMEFTYAVGRIVVWVPAGSRIEVEKLEINALKDPSVTHIAIANPVHAPYGRAAEAALRSTGVYESVKQKLVFGENVGQTLQFVQSGNAEIGVIALALAMSPALREKGRFWEVPMEKYPRLEQGGVILKWARDVEAASKFRTFLIGREGQSILKKFGFFEPRA